MGTGNDSMLDAYLYETNSLLEQLDSLVLAAEEKDSFSEEDVNTIFRIMHTIKGSSAMMEYDALANVAHRAEDLFSIIREKSIDVIPDSLHPELFDLLFQTIDFLRQETGRLENGQPLTTNIDQILQKVNSLISQIQGTPKEEGSTSGDSIAAAVSASPSADFPHTLQINFEDGCGMENVRALMLVNAIKEICADDSFIYAPSDLQGDASAASSIIEHGFLLQFRNVTDRDHAIQAVTGAGFVKSYQTADESQPKNPPQATSTSPDLAPNTPQQPTAPKKDLAEATEKSVPAAHHRENLISVSLSKLDELSAVVGEIVITESMVTASPDLKGLKLDSFTKSARQLRKLTDDLQDVSMSLRMVPVSATFQKMNRIVRDMSKKLGKQAHLTLVGEETELDKTIVDSISDPIMHIVRNSMDHGIEENVQDRIDAGKDPVGHITLSARHTGSEVIIEVADDGQGVNDAAVLKKAIANGLASPDMEYSHKDILNFLMTPGFSTNTEVTEYSGRGVGMDVVKKNVEEVGGSVLITSEFGKGMTTTLKIPLTMAIMDGMEVSVGNSIFTIPIHNIRQSFKLQASDIIRDAGNGELFKCMGHFYPVFRLRELYNMSAGFSNIEDGILIWLEAGEISYCLFVDELLGEQQVVVKPLPSFLNRFNIKQHGIAGCTILGDGNISLILDADNLYSHT